MASSGGSGGALNVSRETTDRLVAFQKLLLQWNKRINLVSRRDEDAIWERHIQDSVQLAPHAPSDATSWLDVGTGAGFPGLVVAVVLKETLPNCHMILVESDARKCAFMAAAARETDVTVEIIDRRIEDVPTRQVDVVSARALAPLPRLLGMCARHLGANGRLLFLKGERANDEIVEARRGWDFSVVQHQSRSAHNSVILEIKELKHV